MAIRSIAAGLLTAQTIAVVHVRISNIDHYEKVKSLLDAGFVAVPSSAVAESLKDWHTAFYGGVFFTLTLGLGLTFLSRPAVGWWHRNRNLSVRWSLILLWTGLIGVMNSNGVSAAATAYAVLIPAAVFAASIRDKRGPGSTVRGVGAIHLLGILVLGGIMLLKADTAVFSAVRDRLLLTNPIGIGVNNFYYRYTLYPAQAFKSLNQELIRTWRATDLRGNPTIARLRPTLARLDWLEIGEGGPHDMVVRIDGERLSLYRQGKTILEVPAGEFLARPGLTLKDFSAETDRDVGLRRITFASLTAICLLTIYGGVYFPVHCLAGRRLGPIGTAAASVFVALAAGSLVLSWTSGTIEKKAAGKAALKAFLHADDAALRIKGLIRLCREKRDIQGLADPRGMARGEDPMERYWLARSLAFARSPDTFTVLVDLLDDPQVNVAYQACRSLGRRGDRRAVAPLLSVIHRSREWYVQLHAYRALKRLGWHQNVFN
jgi:hypothetical protein